MIEVFETAKIGETELVTSIPVVFRIDGTVPCVKIPECDGKSGGEAKVTE